MALNPRHAWLRQLAALTIVLMVWEAAGRGHLLNPLFAPSPSQIGAALVDLFGSGRWELVRHVYLPAVASSVLGSLKVAVGFAFTGACVGEFVAASRGLGYLLSFAQSTYNTALMFALILLILVVVLVIFGIAGRLERYLLRWN